MQNYNSYFLVRLTINRTCLLAFLIFIFVLAISPLNAIDEARAELLTFNDYPQETQITDQYSDLGVIFSGEQDPRSSIPPLTLESKIPLY